MGEQERPTQRDLIRAICFFSSPGSCVSKGKGNFFPARFNIPDCTTCGGGLTLTGADLKEKKASNLAIGFQTVKEIPLGGNKEEKAMGGIPFPYVKWRSHTVLAL